MNTELPPQIAASPADLVQLRHGARELSFFPRLSPKAATSGGYLSRFRGRGMDFDEVRLYQPGDDIRNIDWRVTARTTAPHTKVFREERERPVLVVTDLRTPMFFGSRALKSVTACQVAATLAWAGLNANDRVGGLVIGPQSQRDIRTRRSHHAVLQLIHTLSDASIALTQPQADSNTLHHILEDSRRVAHPGSTVLLVSDFHDMDKDCERHLFQLARHCDVTLCLVYDDLETRLPPPGSYPVISQGQRFLLNSRSADLRQRFAGAFNHRRRKLRQLSNSLRLALLEFPTGEPVMPELLKAYGKKRNRRRR